MGLSSLATDDIHPAALPVDELLKDCEITRTRRSGPGGQHRNKVETAIVIEHNPSGIRAEANEERSQARNQSVAVERLRLNLALQLRRSWAKPSDLLRKRRRGTRIEVSASHADFATIIAETLDVFALKELDHKQTAEALECSSSQLIKLWKKSPLVFQWVNEQREAESLFRLR